MKNLKHCGGMMLAALVVNTAMPAQAANRSWTNTAGGSWEAAGNWNPNGSPTNTDSIRITANGTYNVNFNNTTANTGASNGWLTINDLTIQGDGGGGVPTLLVDFTNATQQLFVVATVADAVQINAGGNLSLNNGTIVCGGGYQVGVGSTGTLGINGGLLLVTNNSSLISTFGTLTMTGGSYSGKNMSVNGKYFLSGGTNTLSTTLQMDSSVAGKGLLVINGGLLVVTNNNTVVGNSNQGTLTISNGAFNGLNLSIGDNGGATSGGSWNLYGGNSSLSGTLTVGKGASSTGNVLLAGGNLTIAGLTSVGSSGYGNFVLSNGTLNGQAFTVTGPSSRFEQDAGTATLSGDFTINASSASGTGRVVTAGGTLSVGGNTRVGSTQNGEWLISGGSNNLTGGLLFADSGSTSRGKIVMNGGTLIVGGTTYMANSGRATFILSNGTFSANAVSMGDNGGTAGGDWSIYGGTATVAGTLKVASINTETSTVLIANSGLLELKSTTTLGSGGSGLGTLTNRDGGTLRFTAQNNPGITVNSGSTAIVQNAIIEFKDAAAASLSGNITKITQVGDNTLSLNHASNSLASSYTFKTNNGQNFAFLNLANGGAFLGTSVTVDSGGRITGDGLVSGSVDVKAGGALSPGNSFGTLTIGNGLTLESNSVAQLDIGLPQYDQISVIGSVSLSNSILHLVPTTNITSGTFTIVDNDGTSDATLGMFQGLTNNAFIDASANGFDAYFRIQYNAGDGNNVVLLATIPEPSAMVLLAMVGILCILRREK